MKKLVMTMLTVLTCGAAFALPVGNPSEASLFNGGLFWGDNGGGCCDPCNPCGGWFDNLGFRVGFYGDYVFNRHMRLRRRGAEGTTTTRVRNELEKTQLFTNAGYLAFNICNRFDIFATLGNTQLYLEGNVTSFAPFADVGVTVPVTTPGARVVVETNDEFSWSVGARGTLWECGCTALGIEGQYFKTRPRLKRLTIAADASLYPTVTTPVLRADYSEWQVGLGLSHRINILVPYVAVKWSGSKLRWRNNPAIGVTLTDDTDTTITLNDLRNRKHWGYAVGVSILACDRAALTVEGRFADEKALYVNGQVRF
jgi:major outer membrane protein